MVGIGSYSESSVDKLFHNDYFGGLSSSYGTLSSFFFSHVFGFVIFSRSVLLSWEGRELDCKSKPFLHLIYLVWPLIHIYAD